MSQNLRRKNPRSRYRRRLPHEHPSINSSGGSRAWTRMVKRVVAEEPWCWLRLPGVCTFVSTTADHVYPKKTHPHLAMARGNLRGACRACNLRRNDTPPWQLTQLRARCAAAQRSPARALGFFG